MSENTRFVSINPKTEKINQDMVRKVKADSFNRLFGKRNTLGMDKGQTVIVKISEEQWTRLKGGKEIPVSELGVVRGDDGRKLIIENDTLKSDLEAEKKEKADALSKLAELKEKLELGDEDRKEKEAMKSKVQSLESSNDALKNELEALRKELAAQKEEEKQEPKKTSTSKSTTTKK